MMPANSTYCISYLSLYQNKHTNPTHTSFMYGGAEIIDGTVSNKNGEADDDSERQLR